MSDISIDTKEKALAGLAAFLSTALTTDKNGRLEPHEGCKSSSDNPLKDIPLSTSLPSSQRFCSVPCLSLKKRGPPSPSASKTAVEQAAASNLADPIKACCNDIHLLPSRIAQNISESFMSLVDSRFRSYLSALADQARKDPNKFGPILGMFSAMSAHLVHISTILCTFRVPKHSTRSLEKGSTISSLIQATIIDLDILGETFTVSVGGVGTMHGVFDSSEPSKGCISSATLMIDTNGFLQSMVSKARFIVKLAKDKISQLYLLSLTPPAHNITGSAIMMKQTPPQQEQGGQFGQVHKNGLLSSTSTENRRLSVNGTTPPRSGRVSPSGFSTKRFRGSYDHLSGITSCDNQEMKESDNQYIKSSGLDLLTQAADALRLPNEYENMVRSTMSSVPSSLQTDTNNESKTES